MKRSVPKLALMPAAVVIAAVFGAVFAQMNHSVSASAPAAVEAFAASPQTQPNQAETAASDEPERNSLRFLPHSGERRHVPQEYTSGSGT